MKKDTLVICCVIIACTAAVIIAMQWPEWSMRRAAAKRAAATLELREIEHAPANPLPALEAWVKHNTDHPAWPEMRVVVLANKGDGEKARREIGPALERGSK